MADSTVYPVKDQYLERAYIKAADYDSLYEQSIKQPEQFWKKQGRRIDWIKPYNNIKYVSYKQNDFHIRWYGDGTLNASANCIDRHLPTLANETAIIWEPDNPLDEPRIISYQELHDEVCRFANALKALGVKKGNVVTVYLPMIPEAIITMLACARIGAPHSVVFGGFSPDALADRIDNGESKFVITADEGKRAGKTIPLKQNVDSAIEKCKSAEVDAVVVVKHTGKQGNWNEATDHDYHDLLAQQEPRCVAVEMGAEEPLFLLYTSGSTGKPKGLVHTTGGYMVYASMTHQYVFDYQQGEVHWCTADIGWITGHSYLVYGPLANGATVVMFEGVPNYPGPNRMAQIIDKYSVNVLYTAPTAIRALMADGDRAVEGNRLDSLRILGTAGEPINPEAWTWFYKEFGHENCPIMDTWWQTETGGVMLTPLPGVTSLKPGSATLPFFGVQPALVNNEGEQISGATNGNLVMLDSWPGQARTIYGDHQRFIETYFTTYPGYYFTGDGARRDEDGYFWITGRVDDVLNVSGHRMGTAELESALAAHDAVAEAAVVGYPHDIKGEGIYIYVTLCSGESPSEDKKKELRNWLRKEIGAIATPDAIQWAPGLPKTRSGKIMRRILRKIAVNECDQLGDISTLADPAVVRQLIDSRVSPPVS